MKADIKEQSVILRPAKPDFSEGLQFAYYLDQAAEGFFRFMLGRESESIIAAAFIDSSHSLVSTGSMSSCRLNVLINCPQVSGRGISVALREFGEGAC